MSNLPAIHQNREAEQAALGCALLDPNLIDQLEVGMFYDIRHQALLLVLKEMGATGKQIDSATVSAHVIGAGKESAVGGLDYLSQLPDKTPSPAGFPEFLEKLRDEQIRRKLVAHAQEQIALAADRSRAPLELLDQLEAEVMAIRPRGAVTRKSNREHLQELAEEMEENAKSPGRIQGLPTGFRELDQILLGVRPGQLVVVGGRPSEGKSALMLQIAYNAANFCRPAAYFSLEMSAKELLFRLQCVRSGVESSIVRSGRMSEVQQRSFLNATSALCRCPIHIDDGDVTTVEKIAPRARQFIKEEHVQCIVVDYLQLLQSSNRKASRYELITEVSAALKRLARSLEVPVIVGAQFSREVEKEGREPRMSDFRDSGAIEQDCDIALLIHHQRDQERGGVVPVTLFVAKNRNGAVSRVQLMFNKPLTRFEEPSSRGAWSA